SPDSASNRAALADALHSSISSGSGAMLGASLSVEAAHQGRTDQARIFSAATARGIDDLRSKFESAQKTADKDNALLATIVGRNGFALTADQKKAAIAG